MKRRKGDKDEGWYQRIPVDSTGWPTCTKCGTPSTLIGLDGECLKCRLERRKQERSTTPGSAA